jgi:hypothetical protein
VISSDVLEVGAGRNPYDDDELMNVVLKVNRGLAILGDTLTADEEN